MSLAHSQTGATIATVNLTASSYSPQESPYLSAVSPFPQPPRPGQALIRFLSLQIFLFCTFHIKGIT